MVCGLLLSCSMDMHLQMAIQQNEARELIDVAGGFQRVQEQRYEDAANKVVKQVEACHRSN